MEKLTSCTSPAVITKLKSTFVCHGIAETGISNSKPCYISEEFCRFAEACGFTHTTTSPSYPQSNGLAEKTVQAAKRMLDKAKAANKDPYLALLEYRNTPVDNLRSPDQLLMSQQLRSILPAISRQLQPQVVSQQLSKTGDKHTNTTNNCTSTEVPSRCLTYLLAHLSAFVMKTDHGDLQR